MAFGVQLLEPVEDAIRAAFGDGVLAGKRRIAHEPIKTAALVAEHFRELKIPMKGAYAPVASLQLLADLLHRIRQAFVAEGAAEHGQVHLLFVGSLLWFGSGKEGCHHQIARFAQPFAGLDLLIKQLALEVVGLVIAAVV